LFNYFSQLHPARTSRRFTAATNKKWALLPIFAHSPSH
jgi:hypothetical protein